MSPAIRNVFPPSFYNNQWWGSRSPASQYAASYWQGAVRIGQANFLEGYAALGGNFDYFVCSFWATNLFMPADWTDSNGYITWMGSEGSFDMSADTGPLGSLSFPISNFMISLDSNGQLTVWFLDKSAPLGGIVGSWHGCPNTLGRDLQTNVEITPLGVWHHYIISFDGPNNRAQIACDRGGGPAWGGGIMDSALGLAADPFPVTFHSGNNTQPMWFGFTSNIPISFTNPPDATWHIQAPTLSSIDLAYYYFGTSDSFFDLTVPGNLDYFVTPVLTPVDLGKAGGNVPLTCLIMHTGNASILAADFRANPYSPTVIYTIGDTVFFNGSNYTSLIINNLNNQPNTSPNAWLLLNSVLQFQYNAATGRLWGGTIGDAPTQPPTGA